MKASLAVADPTTSAADLAQIAQAQPSLWPQIRVHPSVYTGLVAWMDATGEVAASRAVAAPEAVNSCTQCGAPLRLDDQFCGKCGMPVIAPVSVDQTSVGQPEPPSSVAESGRARWVYFLIGLLATVLIAGGITVAILMTHHGSPLATSAETSTVGPTSQTPTPTPPAPTVTPASTPADQGENTQADRPSDAPTVALNDLVLIDSGGDRSNASLYAPGSFTDSFGNVYDGNYFFDASLNPYAVFGLDKGYSTFSGSIVAGSDTGSGASMTIEFYADDKLIFTKTGYTKVTGKIDFSVDVSGATKLTIKASNQGDFSYGWIRLVNATLSTS